MTRTKFPFERHKSGFETFSQIDYRLLSEILSQKDFVNFEELLIGHKICPKVELVPLKFLQLHNNSVLFTPYGARLSFID